jgi:two-component system, OmpR family, KDP operon response regulator KdpE
MSDIRRTLLVVEDEPRLLRALTINLSARRYVVHPAATARAAMDSAASHPPDLVILDLGLPDLDGVDLIRGLRGWSTSPILVLSGRSDSGDKVEALDAGADDYVTKPFGMAELLARLRALLRRSAPSDERPVVAFDDVSVDLAARKVTRGHAEVRLTPTEWKLLEVLVRSPGVLLSKQRLLAEAWGPGYESAQGNLRLYMAQLRRKLEATPARPRHFLNEPGMGYRFQP